MKVLLVLVTRCLCPVEEYGEFGTSNFFGCIFHPYFSLNTSLMKPCLVACYQLFITLNIINLLITLYYHDLDILFCKNVLVIFYTDWSPKRNELFLEWETLE